MKTKMNKFALFLAKLHEKILNEHNEVLEDLSVQELAEMYVEDFQEHKGTVNDGMESLLEFSIVLTKVEQKILNKFGESISDVKEKAKMYLDNFIKTTQE